MSTYEDQPIPRAEMHDDGTLTIAVTFRWRKPWAMDRCACPCHTVRASEPTERSVVTFDV